MNASHFDFRFSIFFIFHVLHSFVLRPSSFVPHPSTLDPHPFLLNSAQTIPVATAAFSDSARVIRLAG